MSAFLSSTSSFLIINFLPVDFVWILNIQSEYSLNHSTLLPPPFLGLETPLFYAGPSFFHCVSPVTQVQCCRDLKYPCLCRPLLLFIYIDYIFICILTINDLALIYPLIANKPFISPLFWAITSPMWYLFLP